MPSDSERLEREEFARGRRAPDEPVAEPRPAATLVLARQARAGGRGAGFEVLLLRRPADARFAAGAFVFPGGTLDPEDGAPELTALLPDRIGEERPFLVTALRELFEETGFLLTDGLPPPEALRQARSELLEGGSFLAVTRQLGVTFSGLVVEYLSRWVTPASLARRYDTRFFLARATPGAQGDPDLTPELESHVWISPGEAIEACRRDRLPMLFPTLKTLEELARHRTVEAVCEARRGRPIRPIRPRLLVRGESVRPVLPGEAGWEEAE